MSACSDCFVVKCVQFSTVWLQCSCGVLQLYWVEDDVERVAIKLYALIQISPANGKTRSFFRFLLFGFNNYILLRCWNSSSVMRRHGSLVFSIPFIFHNWYRCGYEKVLMMSNSRIIHGLISERSFGDSLCSVLYIKYGTLDICTHASFVLFG